MRLCCVNKYLRVFQIEDNILDTEAANNYTISTLVVGSNYLETQSLGDDIQVLLGNYILNKRETTFGTNL